ncbi:MAG: 50S ribosomal protein L25 [Lentimicrobium sp.]|nr:50S ribosomal protein L25 [Lentimicrobium sp.]
MEKHSLIATKRTVTGKKVENLRREGLLPGVMYGHNIKPTPISMKLKDATKVLNSVTKSSIVSLVVDGEENSVLVREKQRNYLKGTYLHIDFQVVSSTEKLRTYVSIVLTGTSPAVKDFDGVVVTGISQIEVEAFPQDLPESFIVDISSMDQIGSEIFVKDIPVPANVEILTPAEELVVIISSTKEEVVEEVISEGPVEPEVIERGKKEEDLDDSK